jgi:hypothetical protein
MVILSILAVVVVVVDMVIGIMGRQQLLSVICDLPSILLRGDDSDKKRKHP